MDHRQGTRAAVRMVDTATLAVYLGELSVAPAIMVKTPATVSPAPGHGRLDWSRREEE